MIVINNFPLSFQIGRTIFNLSIKYPCTIFPCFRTQNLSVDNDYQNLNFPFVKKENNNIIKIQEFDDESDCFSSVNNNLETERKEEEEEIKKKEEEINQKENFDKNSQENLNEKNDKEKIEEKNEENEDSIMEVNNEIQKNDVENLAKFDHYKPNIILIEKQNSNMESRFEEFEKKENKKMEIIKEYSNNLGKEKSKILQKENKINPKNNIDIEKELEIFRKKSTLNKKKIKSSKSINLNTEDDKVKDAEINELNDIRIKIEFKSEIKEEKKFNESLKINQKISKQGEKSQNLKESSELSNIDKKVLETFDNKFSNRKQEKNPGNDYELKKKKFNSAVKEESINDFNSEKMNYNSISENLDSIKINKFPSIKEEKENKKIDK